MQVEAARNIPVTFFQEESEQVGQPDLAFRSLHDRSCSGACPSGEGSRALDIQYHRLSVAALSFSKPRREKAPAWRLRWQSFLTSPTTRRSNSGPFQVGFLVGCSTYVTKTCLSKEMEMEAEAGPDAQARRKDSHGNLVPGKISLQRGGSGSFVCTDSLRCRS